MRLLILGHLGMLGTDLMATARAAGHDVLGMDRNELDITDPTAVARLAASEWGTFDAVINAAAYTAVDRAESERELAFAINAIGPGYLATACAESGTRLIHVSTDFVFDGTARTPYRETNAVNPLGVYAQSKQAGEEAVLSRVGTVVRTAWLFGAAGPSFPRTMIRAWRAGRDLRVVADQVGSPTFTGDLSRVLVEVAERNFPPGIYHAAGPDAMSWHALATQAINAYGTLVVGEPTDVKIEPIATADWPTPTPRPAYSVLSCDKLAELGVAPMRPMAAALADFVRALPAEL